MHNLLVANSFSGLESPHEMLQQLCYCHLNSEVQNDSTQFETTMCGHAATFLLENIPESSDIDVTYI